MDILHNVIENENAFDRNDYANVVQPFLERYHNQFKERFEDFVMLSYENHNWRNREELFARIVDYMRIHLANAL
jgi:iron-sulfur cluster repair protein YtfE (RIC family)